MKIQRNIEEIRKKYIENPLEVFTSKDIRSMSDEEPLDMDYFMNEELNDDFREEGFYFLSSLPSLGKCTFLHLI